MSRDALVVGINKYERIQDLKAPSADAEAIAQRLSEHGEFNVKRLPAIPDKQNNTARVSQKNEVTLTQLEEAIVELFKPEGKHIPDTALLYFSGHGLRKNRGIQEGFLATSDVNPGLGYWGLSLQWLRRLLQESSIKQQIIWLDCCHSGELLNFAEADPGDRGEGRDRCFIAASREFEMAYEAISDRYSVLTQALLQGLDPQRHPGEWVTNLTLVNFLDQRLNPRLKALPQSPLFTNSGGAIKLTRTWEASREEPASSVLTSICPYKSLEYFDCKEEDAKYFYGRTALTDQLLDKVRSGNFLAVLGASGSGKSSVVRAGLLYQLSLGHRLSGSDTWQIRIFQPDEYPLQSLALAFLDAGLSDVERASQLTKAEELIGEGAIGLGKLITASNTKRVVLVVDQFEEVFTLCQDSTERQQFFECLLRAVERLDNKLCLVLTMRADFFSKCVEQEYAGLASKIQEHLVTVTPMNREELEQAITEPAKQVGLTVEPELVDRMIADVEGSPGSLPLLQYTLTELWQQRTQEKLTHLTYNRLGGVKGTLQKRADEVYESLSPEEQQIAKRIFLELTQLGEGTEDTRRRVFKQNLVNEQQSEVLVNRVLQELADKKLVVTSELIEKGSKLGRIAVVDVAHEALIRSWSLLRQWLNENRDALRQKRTIEENAQEWLDKEKARDYLLQGLKLAEAQNFLSQHSDSVSLSSLAQEFVQKSVQRKQNHRRCTVGIVAGVIASLSGLTIYAFVQQNLADKSAVEAKRQTLIAQTQTSEAFILSNNRLDAMVKALQVYKQLKEARLEQDTSLKQTVTGTLQQAVYGVQEYNRLSGHSNAVLSVAFSPDGKTLASASSDKTVKLWNLEGKLLKTLSGHSSYVSSVAFSPDGKTIASASYDKTIKLWNLEGKLLKTLSGHSGTVRSIAFSPDGKMLASASSDTTIKLWNLEGKSLKTLSGHNDWIGIVVFSPDGKTIASASGDKTVKLWNLEGKLLKTLSGHDKAVSRIAFSPDGKTIASASYDKTVKLWSLDGKLLKTLFGHGSWVWSVAFSPDGRTIASASYDKTVKLWNLEGQQLKTFFDYDYVYGVTFSSDGKTIASAGRLGIIKLWSLEGQQLKILSGHNNLVRSVAFSPDGKMIASASDDTTIKLWNLEGKLLATLFGHDNAITSVAFSSDGETIASASSDKTINLWNLEGELLKTLLGHSDWVTSVAFSPDGETIASASGDKTVKLWNLEGKLLKTLSGHSNTVSSLAFSPDGKTIASASYDKTVKLWNLEGQQLKTFSGHNDGVTSVAFSPDGKTIASASGDKTVKLWDLDGELLKTLSGHNDQVMSVAFSPDGKTIASASGDKTVKLWDSEGQQLKTLSGHNDWVMSVVFSPRGKMIASASGDQDRTVILWNLNLDDLLVHSCNWLHDYLKNPNNDMSPNDDRRHICDRLDG